MSTITTHPETCKVNTLCRVKTDSQSASRLGKTTEAKSLTSAATVSSSTAAQHTTLTYTIFLPITSNKILEPPGHKTHNRRLCIWCTYSKLVSRHSHIQCIITYRSYYNYTKSGLVFETQVSHFNDFSS